MTEEAKETIERDGWTYNLHLFGATAPRGHQGCFEVYQDEGGYADGMLWIEDGEVTDYDGIYALPVVVVDWLTDHGVQVPADCRA